MPDIAADIDAGRDGGTRRAIDVCEGNVVDEATFTALIRGAIIQ